MIKYSCDYNYSGTSSASTWGAYKNDYTSTPTAYGTGGKSASLTITYNDSSNSNAFDNVYGSEITIDYDEMAAWKRAYDHQYKLEKDKTFELPDGAKLIIDKDGNYQIDDTDAHVIYKAARIRDHSPHISASDMVADFLKHAGDLGVRRSEMMKLPIELFISWLIIEAAERDGDPVEVEPVAKSQALIQVVKPRCLQCKKYIRHLHARNQFMYCNPVCAERFAELQLSTSS